MLVACTLFFCRTFDFVALDEWRPLRFICILFLIKCTVYFQTQMTVHDVMHLQIEIR